MAGAAQSMALGTRQQPASLRVTHQRHGRHVCRCDLRLAVVAASPIMLPHGRQPNSACMLWATHSRSRFQSGKEGWVRPSGWCPGTCCMPFSRLSDPRVTTGAQVSVSVAHRLACP
jgi:hypothetical protein